MVFIHYLLRRNTFFHRPDGNGHAMLIAAANKFNIALLCALVTYINICRNITAGQMANMHGSIGIRQVQQ